MTIKIKNKATGFTIVEAMVSVVVLSIVMLIVVYLFAATVQSGKGVSETQRLIEEIRNAMVSLEKEINQSNGISSSDCNSCNELLVMTSDVKLVKYDMDSGRLRRTVEGVSDLITSDKIEITSLKFYIRNNIIAEQPRLTISIKANPKGNSKPINVQTTISIKGY